MQLHTFFKCLSSYSVFLYFIKELTRCIYLNPTFLMLHYLESWSLVHSGCIFVNDTWQGSRQEFRSWWVLASLVTDHILPHMPSQRVFRYGVFVSSPCICSCRAYSLLVGRFADTCWLSYFCVVFLCNQGANINSCSECVFTHSLSYQCRWLYFATMHTQNVNLQLGKNGEEFSI